MPPRGQCHYGFEPEDVRQEGALGILLAERRGGDRLAGKLRARARIGRYRKKEREWNRLRIPIRDVESSNPGIQFEKILVHEILDLLPYALKEETLEALLRGDGRNLIKMGRLIKEAIPGITQS